MKKTDKCDCKKCIYEKVCPGKPVPEMEICAQFKTPDGKRPRFCRLAGSVDEMAKILCEEHDFSMLISDEDYETEDEDRKQKAIVSAAKAWLMEVEE